MRSSDYIIAAFIQIAIVAVCVVALSMSGCAAVSFNNCTFVGYEQSTSRPVDEWPPRFVPATQETRQCDRP